MRIPDLTQRVVGYRRWTTNSKGELLPVGTTKAGPWKPGPQHAVCWAMHGEYRMPCLPVADPDCDCGFYALHTLDQTEGYSGDNYVQGIVTGWGRLAVQPPGFRAEWIEVMAIVHPDDDKTKRHEQVAKHYGVPLISYSRAESYALEFGSPMPKTLIPPMYEEETFNGRTIRTHLQQDRTDLQRCRGIAKEEIMRHRYEDDPRNKPIPQWLLDVMDELDPEVPEAMAGLYDIYVPNVGDVLTALNYPPVTNYVSFPEDEIVPLDLADERYLLMEANFCEHIAVTGDVLWLPTNLAEEDY